MLTLRIDPLAAGINSKRVLCAVSGGGDSVALLRLLTDLRNEGALELFAAHYEHGIRGEDSLRDMRFVKDLCAELGVPLKIGRGNVPVTAEFTHEGLESCARRLRHEFLENTREAFKCDLIALAHHRRDRAETVLMHLLRGGGLKGASAMPMASGYIVRPLIDVSPEEIYDYLVMNGFSWREDATNSKDDNPRNALRLTVFPRLKQIYPGFEKALCRFAEISSEEDKVLCALTDEYFENNISRFAGVWIIKKGEKALMRRAIRRILPESGFDITERAINADKAEDTGDGFSVCGDEEHIYITPPLTAPRSVKLRLDGSTSLKDVCEITAADSAPEPIRNNGYTQVLSRAALKGAVVRLWRKGDHIAPLGMGGGSKSLGDYFTDKRFPVPLRHRLPLVAVKDEVLWLPGLGISEKAKITRDTPAVKLEIKISGGNRNAR